MAFGDKIRGFFSKKSNPELKKLELWAEGRRGLEGYVEPRTATNPVTLLLVDRAGEHQRAPVREVEDAQAFCGRRGIPVYDAAVVGYPDRMRRRASDADAIDQQFADIERRLSEDDAE